MKESPFENGVIYKKGNKSKKFIFQKYIFTIRHGTRLIFVCNHGYIRRGPSGAKNNSYLCIGYYRDRETALGHDQC
jgi:hypothetical protein